MASSADAATCFIRYTAGEADCTEILCIFLKRTEWFLHGQEGHRQYIPRAVLSKPGSGTAQICLGNECLHTTYTRSFYYLDSTRPELCGSCSAEVLRVGDEGEKAGEILFG
jgi:hypothetical protein